MHKKLTLSLICFLSVFSFSLFSQVKLPYNNFSSCKFKSLGHRGYDHIFPEEVTQSMEDALKHTHYLEIDLKLTKDSQYVLFHDHSAVSRVTNGIGAVESFTVAQLKALDAGSYMGSQFKGAQIMTLVEAMQMAEKYDGYLYLDVAGLNSTILAQEVKQSGTAVSRILPNVASLAKGIAMRAILSNCPWVWYNGGLYPDTIPSLTWYQNCVANGCTAFEVASSHVGDSAWSVFLSRVHAVHADVWVFTENDSDIVNKCVRYGVDGIENDRPWEIARTVCEPGYTDVYPDSLTTGNWLFNKDMQSLGVGSQLRTKNYINPPTAQVPVFDKCSNFGIASPDSSDAVVMYIPRQDANNGVLVFNNFTPQDDGSTNKKYSVVMDFMMPDTQHGNFVSIYQTSPGNAVDASLFINQSGQIGIWGSYYGHVDPGKWYRLAFTVDVNNAVIKEYLNGKYLGDVGISSGERWTVLNFVTPKEEQGFLLFADNDSETARFYVNALQIRDYIMDSNTIASMGGPSTMGMPIGNADLYNVKMNGMVSDSSLFDYDHQTYYIAVAPGTDLTNETLSYDLCYGASANKTIPPVIDLSSGLYSVQVTSQDKMKVKNWKIYIRTLTKATNIDAGIASFKTPKGKFCGGNKPVQVNLKNSGIDTLASVTITWSVNGNLQTAYNWAGKLPKDSSTTITLGYFNFTTGNTIVKAWTVNPNKGRDLNIANDTAIAYDTVQNTPNPNAGGNKTICSSKTITLGTSAVSGYTYSWTSIPSGFTSSVANPTVTPSVSTTYYLSETFATGGCSRTDSAVITVNPSPLAAVGKYRSVCLGDSTQLGVAAIAGHTYSWVASSGWKSTLANPYVNPIAKRLYTLTETVTSSGCVKTDTVSINVNQVPSRPATATNNGPICAGTTLKLTCSAVTGATAYTWTGDNGKIYNTQNPVITVATAADSSNYGVTVTVAGCTSAHRYTLAKVYGKPTPNLTGADSACGASTSSYSGDGKGTSYTWSINGGSISTGSGTNSITVKWNSSGFAKVKMTEKNAAGCSDTAAKYIKLNAQPAANVGTAPTICSGQSATIGASTVTGSTYSWSPSTGLSSSSTSNPSAGPNATTTYSLTETVSKTGCSNTKTVKVTVNALPSATTGSNTAICNGSSTTIGGLNTSGHTYSWSPTTGLSSSTSYKPTANPTSTTKYTLTEKITSTGCTNSNSVTVTVNPLPAAAVASNASICKGKSDSIGAAAVSGSTYSWSPTSALSSSTVSNPKATPTSTTKYTLTEKITSTGCTKSNSVTITVTTCLNKQDTSDNQDATTGIEQNDNAGFDLSIFPNPFKYSTTFKYTLAERTHITIAIYDMDGRQIASLVDATQEGGEYILPFESDKYYASAGMYFAKIMIGNTLLTRKMIMLK